MPAIVVASAIAAAGTVAGTTIGAKMQSGAAEKAAQLQKASNDRAQTYLEKKDALERGDSLAAQKASYDQYVAERKFADAKYRYDQETVAPYRKAGVGASMKLSHLLGLPDVQLPEAPQPTYPAPPAFLNPPTPGMTMGKMLAEPGTVMMRAPDGTTKAVPQAQAAHYQARGAQVI